MAASIYRAAAGTGGTSFGLFNQSDRIGFVVKGEVIVISRIGEFNTAMREQLRKLVFDVADRIQDRAILSAPSATGTLKKSISKRFMDPFGYGIIVRATKRYASFMEYGTGPMGTATQEEAPAFWSHKAVIKGPPVGMIRAWAAAKGIDPKSAFLIARSIKRRGGLRARPFMIRQQRAEVPTFIAGVQDILATRAPAAAALPAA